VAFGNHESADYGVQDMIDLYTRTQYVVYLVVLMVMVVLCYLTYRGTKKAVQEQRVGSKRARYGNTLLPMLYSVFSAMVRAHPTSRTLFARPPALIGMVLGEMMAACSAILSVATSRDTPCGGSPRGGVAVM